MELNLQQLLEQAALAASQIVEAQNIVRKNYVQLFALTSKKYGLPVCDEKTESTSVKTSVENKS